MPGWGGDVVVEEEPARRPHLCKFVPFLPLPTRRFGRGRVGGWVGWVDKVPFRAEMAPFTMRGPPRGGGGSAGAKFDLVANTLHFPRCRRLIYLKAAAAVMAVCRECEKKVGMLTLSSGKALVFGEGFSLDYISSVVEHSKTTYGK